MTIATIDRLVHHATIFEMNVESFRRRTAIQQRQPATSNLEASDIASTDQNIDIETKMSHNDIDQRHRLEHKGRISHNLYRGR